MSNNQQRRLKLIKGARPGGTAVTRPVARRTVTRRLPATEASVTEWLSRLDEEPVKLPGQASGGRDEPGDGLDTRQSSVPAPDRSGNVRSGGAGGSVPVTDEPARSRRASGGGRQGWMGTALLVATLSVALGTAGLFGYRWHTDRALAQAQQGAVAAARQTTVNFVSISAATVDRDLQRITEGATGDFKEEFTRGMPQVRTAVVENKVDSQGSVLRAGLVTGNLRNAVVLVAVDATVKNSHAPEGRASHYRIQVDLSRDRDSGAWLVSRLQFVG